MPFHVALVGACLLLILETVRRSQGSILSGVEMDAVGCVPPRFHCGNSSVCVHQSLQCDGVEDCPDGEDESQSTCAPRSCVLVDYIAFHTQLIREQSRSTCDAATLPLGCSCSPARTVLCANLTAMPTNIPEHSTFLYLMFDGTASIHLSTVPWPAAISITFTGLPVRFLPEDTFSRTPRVTQILVRHSMVEGWHANTFRHLSNLRHIVLDNNRITLSGVDLNMPSSVQWIFLKHNLISLLTNTTFGQVNAEHISLSFNRIRSIEPGTFSRMTKLKELYLRGNLITMFDAALFHHNPWLCQLDISENPLSWLPETFLTPCHWIDTLHMEGLTIANLGPAHFSSLDHLNQVYFSRFKYCRFTPHVRLCKPPGDGISSVDNLLDSPFVCGYIWFIATAICITNIAVLLTRLLLPQPSSPHGLSITNLCVADLLMGVYLFVIAIQDSRFRGHYNEHALEWTSNLGCQMAGFIALVSSEVSLFTLTMLSVERCYIISHQFSQTKPLGRRYTVLIVTGLWLCGAMMAGLPFLILESSTSFYGANSLCFPLHLHDPFMAGWLYSAVLFCGINTAAILVLGVAYGAMYCSIRHTRSATGVPLAELACLEERLMALRMLLLVLTNVCCWVPVVAVKVAALAGHQVTNEAYAWLAVVAVPINSAVNPLLYSLTTRPFCHQLQSSIRKRRRSSQESLRDTLVRVFSHPRPSLPSVYSSEMPVLTFPRPPSVLSWPSQASTQPLSAAPEARDPESSFSKKPWLHLDTAEQEHLYDQPFIPRAMTEGDDT